MRIGMGGGAASSMATGANAAELDFDSVQRGNPEIERRAQEVINHCWALGEHNPILAIHDVGAGGLSQRLPRADQRRRPRRPLRPAQGAARGERPGAEGNLVQREPGALRAGDRARVAASRSRLICERERCPFAVVGVATEERAAGRSATIEAPGRRPAESTCRWTCCSASRRRCTATSRACARRAAAARPDRRRPAGGRDRRAAPSDRGLQALPDHHRRPHRRRPEQPRPDGRPVAGAGGRLRRDAGRLRAAFAARR